MKLSVYEPHAGCIMVFSQELVGVNIRQIRLVSYCITHNLIPRHTNVYQLLHHSVHFFLLICAKVYGGILPISKTNTILACYYYSPSP